MVYIPCVTRMMTQYLRFFMEELHDVVDLSDRYVPVHRGQVSVQLLKQFHTDPGRTSLGISRQNVTQSGQGLGQILQDNNFEGRCVGRASMRVALLDSVHNTTMEK